MNKLGIYESSYFCQLSSLNQSPPLYSFLTEVIFYSQVNNYTAVALTKLDILDGFDEIKVGVEYLKDGKKLDHFPSSEQVPEFNGNWLK